MPTHKIGIYIFDEVLGQNNHKIVVVPDPVDATKGNALLFEVRLLDNEVAEVELEFNVPLLDGCPGEKPNNIVRKPPKPGTRKIDFKGHARKPNDPPDVVFDKYTVRAFSAAGLLLTELDPIIIICDG